MQDGTSVTSSPHSLSVSYQRIRHVAIPPELPTIPEEDEEEEREDPNAEYRMRKLELAYRHRALEICKASQGQTTSGKVDRSGRANSRSSLRSVKRQIHEERVKDAWEGVWL